MAAPKPAWPQLSLARRGQKIPVFQLPAKKIRDYSGFDSTPINLNSILLLGTSDVEGLRHEVSVASILAFPKGLPTTGMVIIKDTLGETQSTAGFNP